MVANNTRDYISDELYRKNQSSNAKSPKWSKAEELTFINEWEKGTPVPEIAKIMEEVHGRRKYTNGGLSQKRKRLLLPLRIKGQETSFDESTLDTDRWEFISYRCNASLTIKCKKCGEISTKLLKHKDAGCKYCSPSVNDYQEVYFIEFDDFVKVGISYSYENSRRIQFPPHRHIQTWETTYGTARKLEDIMQDEFGIHRTNPEQLWMNGHSECFCISQKENIQNRIEEYFK